MSVNEKKEQAFAPTFDTIESQDFQATGQEARFYDFENGQNELQEFVGERLIVKGPDGTYQPSNSMNIQNGKNENTNEHAPTLADGLPSALNISQIIRDPNDNKVQKTPIKGQKRVIPAYFTSLTIDTESGIGKMLGPLTPRTPLSPFMPISPAGSFYSMIGEPLTNSKNGPIYKVIRAVAASIIMVGLTQMGIGIALFQYGDKWGSWYAGFLSVVIGLLGFAKHRKIIRIYRVLMIGAIFCSLIAALIDMEVLNLLGKVDGCGTSSANIASYDSIFGESCGFHDGCSCLIIRTSGKNQCLNFELANESDCQDVDTAVSDLLHVSVPITWILFILNIAGTLTGFLASDIILTGRQIIEGY